MIEPHLMTPFLKLLFAVNKKYVTLSFRNLIGLFIRNTGFSLDNYIQCREKHFYSKIDRGTHGIIELKIGIVPFSVQLALIRPC